MSLFDTIYLNSFVIPNEFIVYFTPVESFGNPYPDEEEASNFASS